MYGTIGGGASDQDLAMEDQSEQLVWKRGGIPYHFGETFQFRMTGNDAVILGLDNGLTQNPDGTYTGALVKGGDKVAFPIEGFWDVTLDLEHWTMTAELVGRYQWTMVGTINGGSWDQDVDLGDMGRQLVWENTKVPFHKGEEFKFRREKNNAVNLGIDGELVPVEGVENQYVANLKQDGGNITLPAEGYWTLRLDVEAATLTATLTDVFPRAGVIWEPSAGAASTGSASTARMAAANVSLRSLRMSGTSFSPRLATWSSKRRIRRSASPPAGGARSTDPTSCPATSVSRTTVTAPSR